MSAWVWLRDLYANLVKLKHDIYVNVCDSDKFKKENGNHLWSSEGGGIRPRAQGKGGAEMDEILSRQRKSTKLTGKKRVESFWNHCMILQRLTYKSHASDFLCKIKQ